MEIIFFYFHHDYILYFLGFALWLWILDLWKTHRSLWVYIMAASYACSGLKMYENVFGYGQPLTSLRVRKTQDFWHIMWGEKYEILRLIVKGRIQIERSEGNRPNSWLKDMPRLFNCISIDNFWTVVAKVLLAIWIANLSRETMPYEKYCIEVFETLTTPSTRKCRFLIWIYTT